LENQIDTLVLGCTHYPLLKNLLAQVAGPSIQLIDSAEQTARTVGRRLRELHLEAPAKTPVTHRYFVSDAPEKFEKIGQRFLGETLPGVQRVDISHWA
jgi:glutamate racemase